MPDFDTIDIPDSNYVMYAFPGDSIDHVLLGQMFEGFLSELRHLWNGYGNSTTAKIHDKLTLECSSRHLQDFSLSLNPGSLYDNLPYQDAIKYVEVMKQYSYVENRDVLVSYTVEVPADVTFIVTGAFVRGPGVAP